MPKSSFADFTGEWNQCMLAYDTNAEDLAHLRPQRDELGLVFNRAMTLSSRQDALRAELNQTTKDLNETMAQGKDLNSRLKAAVKGHYGAKSEKLIEFQMKPFRRRQKAKTDSIEASKTPSPDKPTSDVN
ncbi:MAG TPA: hypothetical protein VMW27_24815 [Thermoanaerobaculia bacterium]|nr:hypothetical protein [Thermoanaerobaculia bacterium]